MQHSQTTIEETDQYIYFYVDGNGFAVRKNGFAYLQEALEFVGFAHNCLTEVRAKQIEA